MKKLLLILSFFLSACAVNIKLPTNRLDSPEALGDSGRIKLQGNYEGTSKTELTPDLTGRAINVSDPVISASSNRLRVGGGVGVTDNFDVELSLPGRLKGKFQIFGDSRLNAEKGNIPLAVTGSIARNREDDSATDIFGKSGTVQLTELILDGALISGYRVSSLFLVYGGYGYTHDRYHGSYTINNSSNNFKSAVRQHGPNLGVELGNDKVQFRAEFANAKTIAGSSRLSHNYFGASINGCF